MPGRQQKSAHPDDARGTANTSAPVVTLTPAELMSMEDFHMPAELAEAVRLKLKQGCPETRAAFHLIR